MAQVLDYASPTVRMPSRALYRAALVCGIFPIVVGVGILFTYVVSHWHMLPVLGFFFLPIGTLIVIIGIGLLIGHYMQNRKVADVVGLRKQCVLGLLLLLLNFPIGIGCAVVGVRETDRSYFTVTNVGARPAQSFKLIRSDGRNHMDFGSLAPGQSKRCSAIGYDTWTFDALVQGQRVKGDAVEGDPDMGPFGMEWHLLFDGQKVKQK